MLCGSFLHEMKLCPVLRAYVRMSSSTSEHFRSALFTLCCAKWCMPC